MVLDLTSRSSRPWPPSVRMSMLRSFKISCLEWTPNTSNGSNQTPSHTIFSLPVASHQTIPSKYLCSENEGDDRKSASSPMTTFRNSRPSAVCSRPLDSISKKDESIPLWEPHLPHRRAERLLRQPAGLKEDQASAARRSSMSSSCIH